MTQIDILSAHATPIAMVFDETLLATGTAFFWSHDGTVHLVTNWHNVSGKNPITKKHLSETLAEPNKLVFTHFPGKDLNKRREVSIDLYNQDRPVWKQHQKHGSDVDVVTIQIDLSEDDVFSINETGQPDLLNGVGLDVFILGYPLGINTMGFPVWKRGSVATEPEINANDLPMFLVDTASAKGMSGAPVFRRAASGQTSDGNFSIFSGMVNRFVGIYSGRITPQKNSNDDVHL